MEKGRGCFFKKLKTQIFIGGIDLTEKGQGLRLGVEVVIVIWFEE